MKSGNQAKMFVFVVHGRSFAPRSLAADPPACENGPGARRNL